MTRKIKQSEKPDIPAQLYPLLIEISTLFINLPAGLIDSKIQEVQHRICEFLDFDRSTLWQVYDEERTLMHLTHIHQPSGSLQPPSLMNGQDYFPWLLKKILNGETVTISKTTELPKEADVDRKSFRQFGTKSGVYIPLSVGKGLLGILTFASMREEGPWHKNLVKGLMLVAQVFANALERMRMETLLEKNLHEIKGLKQRLEHENVYLQEEVKILNQHSEILGRSEAIKNVLVQAEQVAGTESTVLLLGKTGTGKDLLARSIHHMSSRKGRPLVTINCASLPPSLIENELFGREKGAYTGALTKMVGRFELADNSTLFLDEIGELPLDLQSKLLRVLEEGKFERLGSTISHKVDVRIVAATNRDLEQEVRNGTFREDLFYRLNVFPITLPPLNERIEDIPILVGAFVKLFNQKMGKQVEVIPKKTMQALQIYSWPGNIRELRNTIERAMIVSHGENLVVQLPGKKLSTATGTNRNLDDMMRREILAVLVETRWRVAGPNGAAAILGLNKSTLYSKMKKLGINRSHS